MLISKSLFNQTSVTSGRCGPIFAALFRALANFSSFVRMLLDSMIGKLAFFHTAVTSVLKTSLISLKLGSFFKKFGFGVT